MTHNTKDNTAGYQHCHRIADIMNGTFGITTPHRQVKGRCAADAEQQGNGNTDGCQGESDIGSGISQFTNALSDEDLVDNVI